MEASGTPGPNGAGAPPAAPPPPAAPAGDEGKVGGGFRALALVLALAFLGLAAVMIVVPINPDDLPRCEQDRSVECIDQTETSQTIQNVFAWPAGILAAIASLLSLGVVITGRGASRLRTFGIAAVVLAVIVFAVPRVG